MGEPAYLWKNKRMNYKGETKYFRVRKPVRNGNSTVHADKHCHHLDGKSVSMVDENKVSEFANTCSYCTVDGPDFKTNYESREIDLAKGESNVHE